MLKYLKKQAEPVLLWILVVVAFESMCFHRACAEDEEVVSTQPSIDDAGYILYALHDGDFKEAFKILAHGLGESSPLLKTVLERQHLKLRLEFQNICSDIDDPDDVAHTTLAASRKAGDKFLENFEKTTTDFMDLFEKAIDENLDDDLRSKITAAEKDEVTKDDLLQKLSPEYTERLKKHLAFVHVAETKIKRGVFQMIENAVWNKVLDRHWIEDRWLYKFGDIGGAGVTPMYRLLFLKSIIQSDKHHMLSVKQVMGGNLPKDLKRKKKISNQA